MSRYRQVYCFIWNDDKFPFVSDDCQLVFFHVLTTPYSTPFGLYKASIGTLADEKRWSRERYEPALEEAKQNGFVHYDEKMQMVYVPKFLDYNPPSNPNVLKGWAKLVDELPKCELMTMFLNKLRTLCYTHKEVFQETFDVEFETICETLSKRYAEATMFTDHCSSVPIKDSSKSKGNGRDKIQNAVAYELAEFFVGRIRDNKPDYKEPNLVEWAKCIDLMIRLDNRTPEKIRAVIDWVQKDNEPRGDGFCWAVNVLSPQKLRKQFDRLEMQMRNGGGKSKKGYVPIREQKGGESLR